jgi:GntR family transcriptional regulator
MPRQDQLPIERVTADLRRRIESGEWAPGEGLPSTGELADEYDVSRATVGKAIKRLTGEGKLRTVPRWGTFMPRN